MAGEASDGRVASDFRISDCRLSMENPDAVRILRPVFIPLFEKRPSTSLSAGSGWGRRREQKVKVPTLPQRTREGWGTRSDFWISDCRLSMEKVEIPTLSQRARQGWGSRR